jgi:hypothetical protein
MPSCNYRFENVSISIPRVAVLIYVVRPMANGVVMSELKNSYILIAAPTKFS